ncbi:MAG: XRE family transcriptional regulator [Robiginitomaculum sp.]|nr:MAG: XRE family transcriptional regulator [Robiginitomaculum sp.]
MIDKKLFAGARLKRLRKDLGLTQVRMAADLGVSASYLNLLERNQRPLSARVLIRLAETFEFDLKAFAATPDQSTLLSLREAAADPAIEHIGLDVQDLKDLADAHPRAAQALIQLHQSHRGTASDLASLADRLDDRRGLSDTGEQPLQQVRDMLQAHNNYYEELEEAADVFAEEAHLDRADLFGGMQAYLLQVHGVRTRILPLEVMRGSLRRYDRHSKRLALSELLEAPARQFQLAVQIALLELRDLLDQMVMKTDLPSRVSRRLYRMALANYFAAALIMPYEKTLKAAQDLRYDLESLRRRLGVSLEQLCHRLTSLKKPGARGVDFFLLRADLAGNITKRFGGKHFAYAKTGGSCARLAMWHANERSGEILAQAIALGDGTRYFTLSCAVRVPSEDDPRIRAQRILMLGCPAEEAAALIYADAWDSKSMLSEMPVGLNCRLCERADCASRAFPPLQKRLYADETKRAAVPFAFNA